MPSIEEYLQYYEKKKDRKFTTDELIQYLEQRIADMNMPESEMDERQKKIVNHLKSIKRQRREDEELNESIMRRRNAELAAAKLSSTEQAAEPAEKITADEPNSKQNASDLQAIYQLKRVELNKLLEQISSRGQNKQVAESIRKAIDILYEDINAILLILKQNEIDLIKEDEQIKNKKTREKIYNLQLLIKQSKDRLKILYNKVDEKEKEIVLFGKPSGGRTRRKRKYKTKHRRPRKNRKSRYTTR